MNTMAQREPTDKNEAQTDELTIRITGADLPDDPDDRTAIVNDLGELLADALRENHGIESERVTGGVGPEYTQIGSGCPECGTELALRDYTYTGNGATASASCSACRFRGRAIYRLIDIETDGEDWRSAVAAGKATPHRYEY